MSPFDVIKHLNEKTPLDVTKHDYSPWIINKGLSNTMDTLFFAEAMNKYRDLDWEVQYAFYFHGIPKAKRYGKWNKSSINIMIDLIKRKYNVNQRVAESYLKLMNDSDIKQLEEQMSEGGK